MRKLHLLSRSDEPETIAELLRSGHYNRAAHAADIAVAEARAAYDKARRLRRKVADAERRARENHDALLLGARVSMLYDGVRIAGEYAGVCRHSGLALVNIDTTAPVVGGRLVLTSFDKLTRE